MQLHLRNTSSFISLPRIFTVCIVKTSHCFQETEEQIQFLILKKLKITVDQNVHLVDNQLYQLVGALGNSLNYCHWKE